MTTIWAFIILLGVLITIHEYGYFMAARSVGVKVERFSIGMPPRFITIKSVQDGFLLKIFFLREIKAPSNGSQLLRNTLKEKVELVQGLNM